MTDVNPSNDGIVPEPSAKQRRRHPSLRHQTSMAAVQGIEEATGSLSVFGAAYTVAPHKFFFPTSENARHTTCRLVTDAHTHALTQVINVYVGLPLLSAPYAFMKSGTLGLVAMAFFCFLVSYTGKALVNSFKVVGKELGQRQSFQGVGQHLYGKPGYFMSLFLVCFLFGGLIMITIISTFQVGSLCRVAPSYFRLHNGCGSGRTASSFSSRSRPRVRRIGSSIWVSRC